MSNFGKVRGQRDEKGQSENKKSIEYFQGQQLTLNKERQGKKEETTKCIQKMQPGWIKVAKERQIRVRDLKNSGKYGLGLSCHWALFTA